MSKISKFLTLRIIFRKRDLYVAYQNKAKFFAGI